LAVVGLLSSDVCCEEEQDDSDGDCGNGEVELGVASGDDHHNELHGEAEEEEEVEFEEGDVDLLEVEGQWLRSEQKFGRLT
jgi:hypothetical protein